MPGILDTMIPTYCNSDNKYGYTLDIVYFNWGMVSHIGYTYTIYQENRNHIHCTRVTYRPQ